jgi:hypothetical protein
MRLYGWEDSSAREARITQKRALQDPVPMGLSPKTSDRSLRPAGGPHASSFGSARRRTGQPARPRSQATIACSALSPPTARRTSGASPVPRGRWPSPDFDRSQDPPHLGCERWIRIRARFLEAGDHALLDLARLVLAQLRLRPDRRRPKAEGQRSWCYPMRVLERAALQRPWIVSRRPKCSTVRASTENASRPSSSSGTPAYVNRREIPGRYEGALAYFAREQAQKMLTYEDTR